MPARRTPARDSFGGVLSASPPRVSFPPRPGPDALGPSRSGNSQTLRLRRRLTPAPRAPGDASPVKPLGPRGPGCPHPPAATACPPGPKGAAWDSLPTRCPLARPPETPFRRLGDSCKALRPAVRGTESSRLGGEAAEDARAGGQAWLEADVALESFNVPALSAPRWTRPP